MTPPLLLTLLPGAAIAAGLLVAVIGWRGTPAITSTANGAPAESRAHRLWKELRGGGWAEWRWAVALQAGLLTWLVTGWPVAAAGACAGILGVPVLLASGRASRTAIDRAEAIESWSRRLADVLRTGASLEQAIVVTTTTCPDLLRPQVTTLAARISAGWATGEALRAFAGDLDDATADLVAAALILGTQRRGPGLARTLTDLASSLADDVTMRRNADAERAKPRTTSRALTVIIAGVLAAGPLTGDYLSPYATPAGQAVLAALLTALAAALLALHRLAAAPPAPRLLSPSPGPDRASGAGTATDSGTEALTW